jgi:hypothetical protein
MRKAALPLVLMALAGCQGSPSNETLMTDVNFDSEATPVGAESYVAPTSGREEVPARPSRGRGVAIFHLNDAGDELSYKLIASNIENVVQSHIHLAPFGVNGPIVVFLFGPVGAGGGRTDGVLAEGTITAADFVGPLAGHAFSELLDAIRSGGAYVNVHTNDGVGDINTGAGDFPGGEIRGQISGGHVDH